MDSSVDASIRIADLEAQVRALREENLALWKDKTVLESLAIIDHQRMKKLERMLKEATMGINARGPANSERSIDRK